MEFHTTLIEKLRQAQRIVFFTGAGVSQESGIPTFREGSNSGLKDFNPEIHASLEGFDKQPCEVWRWYWDRRRDFKLLKPNPAHEVIAGWQDKASTVTVITQNIDGFHQSAGSLSVIELHGSLAMDKCRHNEHRFLHDFDCVTPDQPLCAECGGLLRPDVVWFGERLPEQAFEQAEMVSLNCDVFVCIGCSMNVYPAANLPYKAAVHGAYLIQINPAPTDLDDFASCNLQGQAGEVLPALWQAVWEK